MNSKGATKFLGIPLQTLLILALVVGGIGVYTGAIKLPAAGTAQSVAGTTFAVTADQGASAPVGGLALCTSQTVPTLATVFFNSQTPGVSPTADLNTTVYSRLAGGQLKLVSRQTATSSVNLPVGSSYQVYYTGATSNTAYFGGQTDEKSTPCLEDFSENLDVDAVASPNFPAVINSNATTANANTATEAIASAGSSFVTMQIKANTSKAWIGSKKLLDKGTAPLLVVIDYNGTIYDTPKFLAAGVSPSPVSVPMGHTVSNATIQTRSVAYDWADTFSDFAVRTATLQMTANSGQNPAVSDANVVVSIYQKQLLQNTNTGLWEWTARNNVTGGTIIAPTTQQVFFS